MNHAEIEKILSDSVGNPSSGIIHDTIPTMAAAIADALNPKPTKETRVLATPEIRDETNKDDE